MRRDLLLFLILTCFLPRAAADDGNEQSSSKTAKTGLARWLEIRPASISVRYRYQDSGAAAAVIKQLQHRQIFEGRFKFDPQGRLALSAAVLSGNTFTGSWNNTGIGTGDTITNLHLEQLYLSGQPINGLSIRCGGLPIVRGESTEITSYDNDGYIVGERIELRRPKDLFFDEILVTFGYLGDFALPNLNKRFHRLKQSNYHHFLIGKQIGPRLRLSADYTFHEGAETLRQALLFRSAAIRVFDAVRFENYQRLDVKPAYGVALTGEKTISPKNSIQAGWANIDSDYGRVNGDRYFTGKRLFAAWSFKLASRWILSFYSTRAFERSRTTPNRLRFDAVLSYDLGGILRARP